MDVYVALWGHNARLEECKKILRLQLTTSEHNPASLSSLFCCMTTNKQSAVATNGLVLRECFLMQHLW